jgi:hypothetical protein
LRNKIFLEHKDEIINDKIADLEKQNKELEEQVKELNKLTRFSITKKQQEQIKEWDKTHRCTLHKENDCDKYVGAIGGHLTYEFHPTSIGTFITVKCACGEKLELDNDI